MLPDLDIIRNDDLGYPIVVADDIRPVVAGWLDERNAPFIVLCDAQRDVRKIARSVAAHRRCKGVLAFELGEVRKRFATLERVHEALVKAGADRNTCLVGVGGGVSSDLFGFAAATFMRGVPYVHIATTLVAMADAAVGGKTGVDLAAGKNLAGVFCDPAAVFGHVGALETLPYRSLREGLAEVVKAAIIEGDQFFDSIETLAPHPLWRWPWLEIVAQAVKVKTMIVLDDREEHGIRELLNLGHTFGHALESASKYSITHGAGVALGLRAAGVLALRTGRYSEEEHFRVLATMALLGMPLRTAMPVEAVFSAMRNDKKRRDGALRFVLPRAIGDIEYGVHASDGLVKATLAALRRMPDSIG
ncbi:MAG TPA: 3-dehydroquinate synthase family protein [Candidatus Baltobacteraceae bacterium]|nr:3-dehydroquinate synthase family protein [Candidatus Baltobacteraceae bacterium]